MGVNKVIYNNTTLIDLTGDTVTADTLAEGVVAHDASGERIVGTMSASNEVVDDTNTVVTMFPADGSVKEYHGDGSTLETLFNEDESITEIATKNGETKTKQTTFTNFGVIEMYTDDGNQIHYGETEPTASVGIDGDVFILKEQIDESLASYTPIEYVRGTGQQYFDLGFKHNQNTRIVMKVKALPLSSLGWIFGARNSSSTGTLGMFFYYGGDNKWGADYAGNSKRISISGIGQNDWLNVDFNKNVLTVNDFTHTFASESYTSNYSMTLLALNNAGSVSYIIPADICFCQVYDNGVLIRDCVAALHPTTGEACLYDKLNNEYRTNAGTGSFVAGAIIDTTPKEIAMYMKINGAWTLLAEVA